MNNRTSNSNRPSQESNSRSGSRVTKLLTRMFILAILLGALAFTPSERTVVKVEAEDCSTVWFSLEQCYYTCAGITDIQQAIACYNNCEASHAMAGATCSMPSHSPMMITGGGCDPVENGQRAFDNCMAGTLPSSWQDQFVIYMAYYDDLEISCGMIAQGVEAQGCF